MLGADIVTNPHVAEPIGGIEGQAAVLQGDLGFSLNRNGEGVSMKS